MDDEAALRARLAADGYDEVLTRTLEPHTSNEMHDHPYDARLHILAGELVLGTPGGKTVFRPGDTCEVPRGARHFERYGAAGATLLIGRRRG